MLPECRKMVSQITQTFQGDLSPHLSRLSPSSFWISWIRAMNYWWVCFCSLPSLAVPLILQRRFLSKPIQRTIIQTTPGLLEIYLTLKINPSLSFWFFHFAQFFIGYKLIAEVTRTNQNNPFFVISRGYLYNNIKKYLSYLHFSNHHLGPSHLKAVRTSVIKNEKGYSLLKAHQNQRTL